MPSKSKAQHNFMAAVANNPSFAKKAGVPQSVGKEFNNADKGKTFKQGGDMKKMNMGGYAGGGMAKKMAGGGIAASKMGAVKTGKTPDGVATKGKTKGKMITMKNGGKC
jgi:hypothetical protein